MNQAEPVSLVSDRDDGIDEAALTKVMQQVPRGAALVAGVAVALLVIGWLLIYLLVFVPRGVVG